MVFGNHEANIRRREELKKELRSSASGLSAVRKKKYRSVKPTFLICGMDDRDALDYLDENSPEVRFAELREHKKCRDSFISSLMRRIRDDRKRSGGRIDMWRRIQRRDLL